MELCRYIDNYYIWRKSAGFVVFVILNMLKCMKQTFLTSVATYQPNVGISIVFWRFMVYHNPTKTLVTVTHLVLAFAERAHARAHGGVGDAHQDRVVEDQERC